MPRALVRVFLGTRRQSCTAHFNRNVLGKVPMARRKEAARMLKAIRAQDSRGACKRKTAEVAGSLDAMRLGAAKVVRNGVAETLAYTGFPPEHWRRVRANNGVERINRKIRRRTRAGHTFPDDNSALMLVTARLKHIAEKEWGERRCLDMKRLEKMDELGRVQGQIDETEG